MLFPDLILILLLMASADALWWQSADGKLRAVRGARLWRTLLAIFMALQMAYLFVALALPWEIRSSRSFIPMAYHTQAYIWHMIVLPVLVLAMIWGKFRNRRRHRTSNSNPPPTPSPSTYSVTGPSRRQVLAATACAVPPLISASLGAAAMGTLSDFRIRRFTLRLPTLPREFDGMTIAQVSDLHIGRFLHPDRLPQIIETVNAMEADFIAFTGDLIDLSLEDLPAGIDFLHKLEIRHGMAICEGNHDLVENRGAFERTMKEAELPLLISDAKMFPFRGRKLQFLALPWNGYDAGHFEAMKYVQPLVDPQAFPILLAHHPHGFDAAAQAGLPLTLSGHTHGGQLMLNEKLGAGAVRFRYISGLYQKAQSSLLVCNGIGNWFPLRINAPAEILHITLKTM